MKTKRRQQWKKKTAALPSFANFSRGCCVSMLSSRALCLRDTVDARLACEAASLRVVIVRRTRGVFKSALALADT